MNIDNQHSAGNQGHAGNLYTRGPRSDGCLVCPSAMPSACRRGRLGRLSCRLRAEGHAFCAWLHARVAVDRDFRGSSPLGVRVTCG